MGRQKSLRRCARVVTGAIMDQKQVLDGVIQDHLQERLVIFRVKPAFNALIEQAPRKILNGPEELVAFALATRFDLGLLPTPRPRVTQRAPLRKARLIFKQDQPVATLGATETRRPLLLKPDEALGLVEMIRHKTGLLKRKPHVVPQGTDILAIVEHPELTPDQHPEKAGGPACRLKAHHERSGLNQLDQSFPLLGGQLGLTAPRHGGRLSSPPHAAGSLDATHKCRRN